MFENIDPVQILSYGVIGLGFLLAFLAYLLLAREQKKKTPQEMIVKAIYSFMVFSFGLCLIGVANEVFGGTGSSEDAAELAQCLANLTQAEAEWQRQRAELMSSTVSTSDLSLISDTYFKEAATREETLSAITQVVRDAERVASHRNHYAHQLFELELMIPHFGNNIPTGRRDEAMRDAYSAIQELLQGIRFYQGPINGDQETTRQALVSFQQDFNQKAGQEIFDPDHEFGFFGYRTLEAVRSTYRGGHA